MMVSQMIGGLTLGSKIKAPSPFTGDAEIVGFRVSRVDRNPRMDDFEGDHAGDGLDERYEDDCARICGL